MQPYAKSTQRRQKRKEKSALKADLGEVEEALDEMGVDQFPGDNAPGETGSTGEQAAQGPKQQKGARLTQAKRKKEL